MKKSLFWTTKEIIHWWKDYIINSTFEKIKNQTLSETGVHSCLRHIPIRGYADGYPEELYILTDSCIKELLEYSKAKDFVSKDCTVENFLKKHGINKESK